MAKQNQRAMILGVAEALGIGHEIGRDITLEQIVRRVHIELARIVFVIPCPTCEAPAGLSCSAHSDRSEGRSYCYGRARVAQARRVEDAIALAHDRVARQINRSGPAHGAP